jgi:alcohol dehydrogenase (cytochrome c)
MTEDNRGTFLVLDSRTGQILRRRETGGAMAGGVIAYAINGKEFVAYTSGNASQAAAQATFGEVGHPTVIIEALP